MVMQLFKLKNMKKNMKKNIYSTFLSSIYIVFVAFTVFGCRKEKDIVAIDGSAQFVFNVSGVNNFTNNTENNKLATKNIAPSQHNSNAVKLNEQINIISSSKESSIINNLDISQPLSGIKNKLASTTPVKSGIKYRILLYNADNNNLIRTVEATVGITESIPVEPGVNYKWYAYSFNSEDGIDPPTMEGGEPLIETLPDKELLWASSGNTAITAETEPTPLSITFEHKVAEFVLEIDIKHLNGKITDLNATFDDDYFYTGSLNVKSGNVISNNTPYLSPTVTHIDFEQLSSVDSTIYRAYLYTTNTPNLGDIKVKINSLTIKLDNDIPKVLHEPSESPKEIRFSFENPAIARSHIASIDLNYVIPSKKILHVAGTHNGDDIKSSFTAQPNLSSNDPSNPLTHRTPYNMLKQVLNFGTEPNSIVYTEGFTHIRCYDDGRLHELLVSEKPDIVIIAFNYVITANDRPALITYLNQGGVVIMMTDSAIDVVYNNNNPWPFEVPPAGKFLDDLFGNPEPEIVLSQNPTYLGGTIFKLNHENKINDRILVGPFGDLRHGHWGSDTYPVVTGNIPIGDGPNEATLYSNPQPDNHPELTLGTSMFKHNSMSFFWIGDGSFLSTAHYASIGWSGGGWGEPFAAYYATNPALGFANPYTALNYDFYPAPKMYGTAGNGILANTTPVYNAPLFANLIAWAIYQAEFFGINSTP